MYCIYCGDKNPRDARFCGNCGRPTVTPVWHKDKSINSLKKKVFDIFPTKESLQIYPKRLSRHEHINSEKTISLVAALLFVAVVALELLRHLTLSSTLLYIIHYFGYALIVVGLFTRKYPMSGAGFSMIAIDYAIRAYEFSKGAFGLSDYFFDQEFQCIVFCISYTLIIFGVVLSGKKSRCFAIPAILLRVAFRVLMLMDALYFTRSAQKDIVEIFGFIAICILRWKNRRIEIDTTAKT